jgi:uncharacterized SAM-binding protein YcdF (DUF218 family)
MHNISNTNPLIYDAIIVLAHRMDAQGHINQESSARMDKAVEFFHAATAPFLVTTGWALNGEYAVAMGQAMRDYAIKQFQVPEDAIFCDTNARDTVGDAVFSKRNVIQPKGWNRLLVVTTDYHVKRAHEIFTFIYGKDYSIEVKGANSTTPQSHEDAENTSIKAFHSTFAGISAGDDAAIWERLRSDHPFYNGKRYPKF